MSKDLLTSEAPTTKLEFTNKTGKTGKEQIYPDNLAA